MLSTTAYLIYRVGTWVVSIFIARLSCQCWFGRSFINSNKTKSLLLLQGMYLWVLAPYFKDGLATTLFFAGILSVLVAVVWLITFSTADFTEEMVKATKVILEILSNGDRPLSKSDICIEATLGSSNALKDFIADICLNDLEKEGLIVSDLKPPVNAKAKTAQRKFYTITDSGRKCSHQLTQDYNKLLAENTLANISKREKYLL